MKTTMSVRRGASAGWRCFSFILLVSVFGLRQIAHAVSPPPDGGYPGGNTAEGQNALLGLTTGGYNTAVGYFSLSGDAQGQFNTALGAGALLANVGDPSTGDGILNTATGAAALLSNTTGSLNTANGAFALFSNSSGMLNTATGRFALFSNGIGIQNTADGASALYNNTIGNKNTAVGRLALFSNTTGNQNTATGFESMFNDGNPGSEGSFNVATGAFALYHNNANNNTAIGWSAMYSNMTGGDNVAIGFNAGYNLTTASNVTCLGVGAGMNHATGDNDLYLGNPGVDAEAGTVRLGTGDGVHTRMFLAGVRGTTTGVPNAIPVYIDSLGQLGTTSSSRRFKHDIKPMNEASDAILALRPVTFHYRNDRINTPQFGLIAEEVADVNPDLVVRDDKGEIYTVRYDAVNAMLLNEFLKEHQKVQKQEVTIAHLKADLQATALRQQKQIEALTVGLQKVSAELEASKPIRQLAKTPGEKGSGHPQAKPNRS